jgi:hypothetical protein
MKKIWEKIRKTLGLKEKDDWVQKQMKQMAKLRGKIILM